MRSIARAGEQRDSAALRGGGSARIGKLGRVAVLAAAAGFGMILAAAPAAAQDIANVKSVEIAVQGRVQQHCALGSIATTDLGDLTRPGLAAAQKIQFDCNVPFTMKIKAQNGALVNADHPLGVGPYAGSVPYNLDVELPVRRPQAAMVSRAFEGRLLAAGQSISSQGGIAMDGLMLRLAVATPTSEAGLLAGQYGEVIEITVAPN